MGEFLEADGETAAEAALQSDAAGVGLAMDRARAGRRGKRGDEAADRFLAAQEALIGDQRQHLREQFRNLGLDRWSKRLRLAFQALTILAAVLALSAIGWMAFDAAHADGVVIEAFSAPPDLAAKGLTGQVLASQLQDRLNRLQAATYSARPETSFSHGWGEDVKVEIPETGVSVGDLQRLLRGWLGHETKIGGEVYHTPTGLGMTVRASDHPGDEVAGAEDDLPGLLQKGAEALYATTQPYRYGDWLLSKGRLPEARVVYEKLVIEGPQEERAWALAALADQETDPHRGEARARQALAIDPNLAVAWLALADSANRLSDDKTSQAAAHRALEVMQGRGHGGYSDRMALLSHTVEAQMNQKAGDYAACRKESEAALALARDVTVRAQLMANVAFCMAWQHETSAARQMVSDAGQTPDYEINQSIRSIYRNAASIDENWPEFLRLNQEAEAEDRTSSFPGAADAILKGILPNEAVALAWMGRLDEAKAIMARDPTCPCAATRAFLAEQSGDFATADRLRVEDATKRPIWSTYRALGRGRLRHGDWDGAIAAYRQGVALGPAYADNYEGWGDALLAKGDAAGAIAKFQEAQKTAPRWGGLHLKWGEALMKLGKRDEARAQFKAAATMDLTPTERTELAAQKV